ncbi:type 4 prepilin peptidase 1 Aspartic peptidase. MEROPS family A24A [Desulfacinum hydrothermale DSM 13146]|uniref:Prepilin leader peptidase/N-methyltransferase n=1 Tax=Desulfacinum hydrothermale DSM 13146 TaxID=1121390 RepID=A0A1W1XMS2_9BACT|nr:A24 family peptidase [Desulfacinum hydrothermale]SMC25216.1 type 4 prepilin peptidase 1 Aspartic peptidase. MEROPS family A24A [Desulfacinum hydrothermale DSM 13146]
MDLWKMEPLIEIFLVAVGCCLGSFFNVVIHRLPSRQSLVFPGSRCPSCRSPIAWYDNLPLLSYLLLRGRCRSCKARISLRYPLVELLTGILALLLYRQFGLGFSFVLFFIFSALLLLIAFIDLDTYLIPDVLSLSGLVVGLIASLVGSHLSWSDSLLGALLGGGLFYAVAWAYQALRKQDGLGGGDIKLLAMIGAFTGWQGVVFTIFVSSVLGTAVGLGMMVRHREKMASARIPFGPFLSLGAICYLFWGKAVFQWYLGFLSG